MKQILTKSAAVAVHPIDNGVYIERHSWLGRRTKRMPDAIAVACFAADELRELGEALIEEAERWEVAASAEAKRQRRTR